MESRVLSGKLLTTLFLGAVVALLAKMPAVTQLGIQPNSLWGYSCSKEDDLLWAKMPNNWL